MGEVTSTALLAFAAAALLLASALASRITRRTGLPIPLLFLVVGMLAGQHGVGGLRFDDHRLALRLGLLALAVILFDGGLNTSLDLLRRWWAPAVVLATAGVLLTAALTAVAARALGLAWGEACLLGAVVSSTDAAAVFTALRASGVQLKRRVGVTLELESGLNDPMAIVLTLTVVAALAPGASVSWPSLAAVPLQLAIGAVLGVGVGLFARFLLRRAYLDVGGLYPVLTMGIALMAFALSTLFQGSGFLAVYLAAMVLGAVRMPYHAGILRVHDALAWFAQVTMFLLLGLLVAPAELPRVAAPALGIGVALAFVARPVAVAVCLLPFGYPWRESFYIGWIGLRGAVPIILAMFLVLAGVPGAGRVFDLVFFIVVVNSLLPGATLRWITRRLGLESAAPPPSPALLEITSTRPTRGQVLGFYVDRASAVCDASIGDLPFPEGASALLVVRGDELLAPRGPTVLRAGDHVYVFSRPEDEPLVHLLFGREERD